MTGKFEYKFPDEYRDPKKIGAGGTAEIFLAHISGRVRPVVLKLFFPDIPPDLVEREMEIAGRLHFPGMVRLEKSGTVDDRLFLQMEHCPGFTLDRFTGQLNEQKLLSILSAATVSLHILHQSGYVHNDIKPGNFFAPRGMDRTEFRFDRLFYLQLIDFSLARKFGRDREVTPAGTVGYMSPEMILKKEMTPSSDLFSLGVMAYNLACGQMPFGAPEDDPLQVNARITEGDRPALCGPGRNFSSETAELIGRLLEIDPANRPASASDLLELLSRTGSPYPHEKAIRPRFLLSGKEITGTDTLREAFGENSFSPRQLNFVDQHTAFDPAILRSLLEHNFDRGRFIRHGGHWRWISEAEEAIEWPASLIRFSLRPLRGRSLSCHRLAIALSIIGRVDQVGTMAEALPDGSGAIDWWTNIPESRRAALLFAVGQKITPGTKKTASGVLVDIYANLEGFAGLNGRLLYDADRFDEAYEQLMDAVNDDIRQSQIDRALVHLDLAFDAGERLSDQPKMTETALRRAGLFKDQGQLQQAREEFNHVLKLAGKSNRKEILALAYKELGDICKALSDYSSGIEALDHALRLFEELEDRLEVSHTLNNLGNMNWIAGKNDEALEFYKKALEIQTELESERDIASSLSNIGSLYLIKGEYRAGISYLNKSLAIKEKLGNFGELARTWNNLGVAYQLLGDLNQAMESFKRSLEYNRQTGDQNEQLINILNLTETMIIAGRLTDALSYLKEGSCLAEDINSDYHRGHMNQLTGTLLCRMGYYQDAEIKLKKATQIAERLENQTLLMASLISLARMYLCLRENDIAGDCLDKAESAALSTGDKNALFHVALLRLRLTGQTRHREQAETLGEELETPRDTALFHLTCLEANNHNKITAGSDKYLTKSGCHFNENSEDIELARYHMAAGEYHLLCDQRERAEDEFNRALRQAERRSMLPEQWQAAALLAEISFARQDYEKSFAFARQATEVLKKIAVKINDRERLSRLYNDRRIVDLLERIKSLQTILSQQKGATVR